MKRFLTNVMCIVFILCLSARGSTTNIWSYTRLGKMDLPEQEVIDLLSNGNVTIKISR